MKKIVIIMISAILFLGGCKKENILSSNNSDIKSTNMKMNYYGRILEYTVNYSPSTNKVTVEGKDAKEAQQIINSYPNACVLVETENKFRFFRYSKDYFDYQSSVRPNYRTTINNEIYNCNDYKANIEFYLNSYQSVLLKSETIDLACTPVLPFQMKQPCNDGTNNACNFGGIQLHPGIKNPWVGSSINDEISSIYFRWNNTQNISQPYVTLVLYQDIDYGGKCIIFWSANSPYNSGINNLKDYKINTLLKNWNDRTSSYEVYM